MNRIEHILWTDVGGWTLPELYERFGDGEHRLYEMTRIYGDGSSPTTYCVWGQFYYNKNKKLYTLHHNSFWDDRGFVIIEYDEFGHPNQMVRFDKVGEIV